MMRKLLSFTLFLLFLSGLFESLGLDVSAETFTYFDQKTEFPNYFLPEGQRNLEFNKIPKKTIAEIRPYIREALGSIFARMTIPVVENGKTITVRCFDYLSKEFGKVDPHVEIILGGGPVRSALSEIYSRLYEAMQKDPKTDPKAVLKKIAAEKEDLPAGKVIGIGSDLDTFFKTSRPDKIDLLEKDGEKILNSAIKTYGKAEASEAINSVFFILGYVKDYESQMMRAKAGGGSELDHLSFSLSKNDFVEPPYSRIRESIVDDFIRGVYRYLPPGRGASVEDQAKIVIRGPRAMAEIPFLSIHPDDQKFFISEVNDIRRQIAAGQEPSEKAMEQFDKLARNSRFSGAHNRFYRSKPGSAEVEFLKLSEDAAKTQHGHPNLLPEFTDAFTIGSKPRSLNGFPKKLLMNPKTFISKYTNNGVLYHGTDISSGIGILRGGLYVSKDSQGKAQYGRGGYMTGRPEFVEGFTSKTSLILNIPVRQDLLEKANILEMEDAEGRRSLELDRALEKIEKQAERQGRDLNEVLARDYGIDLITSNGHVLVQNTQVLDLPKNANDLSQGYVNRFNGRDVPLAERVNAGIVYEVFGSFRRSQGESVEHLKWKPLLKEALKGSSEDKLSAFHALLVNLEMGLKPDGDIVKLIEECINAGKDAETKIRAISTLLEIDPANSKIGQNLRKFAFGRDESLQVGAAEIIGKQFDKLGKYQSNLVNEITEKISKTSDSFKNYFLMSVRDAQQEHRLYTIAETLVRDPTWFVRKDAYSLLSDNGWRLGNDASRAVVKGLKEQQMNVRQAAADCLINVDLEQQKSWIFPALEEALRTQPPSIRSRIALSLASGATLPEARTTVLMCLKDNDSNVRQKAIEVLSKSEIEDPKIISALRLLTKDKDKNVSKSAKVELKRLSERPIAGSSKSCPARVLNTISR